MATPISSNNTNRRLFRVWWSVLPKIACQGSMVPRASKSINPLLCLLVPLPSTPHAQLTATQVPSAMPNSPGSTFKVIFVTQGAAKSQGLETMRRLIGHHNITTTQAYSRYFPAKEEDLEVLDDISGSPNELTSRGARPRRPAAGWRARRPSAEHGCGPSGCARRAAPLRCSPGQRRPARTPPRSRPARQRKPQPRLPLARRARPGPTRGRPWASCRDGASAAAPAPSPLLSGRAMVSRQKHTELRR